MANYAVIVDGVVENIIVADSEEIAKAVTGKNCVAYTVENPAHIGLGFDGEVFEQPPVTDLPAEE